MPLSATKTFGVSVWFLVLTIDCAAAEPRVDLLGDPLPDGVLARIGSSRMRHGDFVSSLFFSPDGKSLVSTGSQRLRIWDVATGRLRRNIKIGFDRYVASVFTDEGIAIADASLEPRIVHVQLVDPASGAVRRRVEMQEQATTANLTFSRDGKRLAFNNGNTVRLGDAATGRELLRIPVTGRIGRDIAFAPDGKALVIADFSDTVPIHDTVSGKKLREFKSEGDQVRKLTFSPDGRFLAAISDPAKDFDPGHVRIWDLKTGTPRHRLRSLVGLSLCAAFSPDGKYVAIGCQHHDLILWDMETGVEVRRYPTDALYATLAFSPDGKSLAAASGAGTIRLWDVATGRVLPASVDPFVDGIGDLRFSADGRRLLGRAGVHLAWEPATGRELRRTPRVSDRYWPSALSPDESQFATADKDGTIHLWDAATGKAVRAFKGHEKWVYNMQFTPDGRRLISSSPDNTLRIWDVTSGRETHKLATPGMSSLTISPDGRWLAAPGRPVVVWDLSTGQEKARLHEASGELAFSPDGRLLAAVGGGVRPNEPGEVTIWDIATGVAQHSRIGHKSRVYGVAFSPDGRMLATGDGAGHLLLWELAGGRQRHQFIGHTGWIQSVAFSPDGRLLACASYDAPAFVWDVTGAILSARRPLADEQLSRCWSDLANADAAVAFQAMRRLVATPEQAVGMLREHLKSVPAPDLRQIRRLVQALDSDEFATREKAAEELEKQADAAAAELRKAAKESSSLYVRRMLQQILEGRETKPETLRAVRAVEVLEWLDAPDATRLLDELAKGAADARLTREAIAARERLRKSQR